MATRDSWAYTGRRRRSRRRRRLILINLAVYLSLFALLGLLAAREAFALRSDLMAAQTEFDLAVAVTDPILTDIGSFKETEAALTASAVHLRAADRALTSAQRRAYRLEPLLKVGAHLPGWLSGMDDVPPVVDAARDLARAGLILSDSFNTLTTELDESRGQGAPVGVRLTEALSAAEPGFVEAREAVESARAARARIHDDELGGPLSPAREGLVRFDNQITAAYDNLSLLADLPRATRSILGMDGPRTYAILGQNSAELRPTGGFIGSLGIVSIDRGTVIAEDYRGSYTFDDLSREPILMPEPMSRHLGGNVWTVRDANWSPDFPSSAATIEQMLDRFQAIRVDGVIGFTTYAVAGLLDFTGPLPVEGFDQPLTAALWYDLAEQSIYFSQPWDSDRNIEENKATTLAPILRAVMTRLQETNSEQIPSLLRTLQMLTRERQLLVAFHDDAPATLARRYNADGRFAPPPTGDVLAVVDANLTYSKVGAYIDQSLTYEVWLNERGVPVRNQLSAEYRNRVQPDQAADWRQRFGGRVWDAATDTTRDVPGLYGTYTRVYLPRGSRLFSSDEAALPKLDLVQELGFLSAGHYVSVPAASSRGFTLTYQTPTDLQTPGVYQLRVIKQPGTPGPAITVRLHLPPGMEASADLPASREGDTLIYQGTLTSDLDLRVSLGN